MEIIFHLLCKVKMMLRIISYPRPPLLPPKKIHVSIISAIINNKKPNKIHIDLYHIIVRKVLKIKVPKLLI